VAVPVAGLLDADYLHRRSTLIDPGPRARSRPAGHPAQGLAIGAAAGRRRRGCQAAPRISPSWTGWATSSLTSSIEAPFGSRMMSAGSC
jgi:gamma-glutamyltranspeptidase / glutathione hydrolase